MMRGLLFLFASVLAAQNTASIEGTVTDKAAGTPVRDAIVFVYQQFKGGAQQSSTDANGAFRLDGLAPGLYSMEVRHPQYPTESRPIRDLALAADEHKTGITLQILPPGAISGRITDSDGEPLSQCQVRAMAYNVFGGERVLTQRHYISTDEAGYYRLYHILPGRYFVTAYCSQTRTPAHGLMPDAQVHMLPRTGFKRAYWGGDSLDSASPLLVRPGIELQNTDFQMAAIPVYNVTGSVSGWEGDASVVITPVNATKSTSSYYGNIRKGGFLVNGIQEGAYDVVAFKSQPKPMAGKARINVPLDQPLHLEPSPGFDWPVVIRTEDAAAGFQVASISMLQRESSRAVAGQRQQDGSFVLKDVTAGSWSIQIQASTPNFFIKSVRAGNQEFRPGAVQVGLAFSEPLQITISDKAPVLTGILIPESEELRSHIRMIAIDGAGSFYVNPRVLSDRLEWSGLAPGRYRLLAARVRDLAALLDGSVLKELSRFMKEVTLEEGGRAHVDLNVVPEETLARLCVY